MEKSRLECEISVLPHENNEIKIQELICRRCQLSNLKPISIHLPYLDKWIDLTNSGRLRKWFTSMDSEIIENSYSIIIARRNEQNKGELH